MPAPAVAPRVFPGIKPVPTVDPQVMPQPELWPTEICPQQKREHASPDVSP